MVQHAPWAAFAAAADAVAATRRKLEKAAILGDYFVPLDDHALALAARYLAARPFPLHDQRKLNVGGSQVRGALEKRYPALLQEVAALPIRFGDLGDVAAAVLERRDQQPPPTWTLRRVEVALTELAATRGSHARRDRIADWLDEWGVLEGKYFVKLLLGELRIGLREGLVLDALARAFDRPLAEVSRANMLLGDLGECAVRARSGTLDEARMRLFHPLTFMLATAAEDEADIERAFSAPYYVEDKYDGIRGQLHKGKGERVTLYSRTLDEISGRFPELATAARTLPGELILDGEIVAWKEARFLGFQALQQRLGRKRVSDELLARVPVRFVVYDLLFQDGTLWLEAPLAERRFVLEQIPLSGALTLSPLAEMASAAAVVAAFEPAVARGVEGLMVKDPRSSYRPGRRGREWLKLKRPLATLDVVVTAVEWGHGRRRNVLSDYTFAVRRSEEDDTLLNIGKAYSGLTDVEIREMTGWFRANTLRDFGRSRLVAPEIVIEVAFDAVQISRRHKSGYALRFPRIVRLRPDKSPAEIDTLATVAALAGPPPAGPEA